ncbi:hypothetical protein [Ruegeria jejuensis]|uniref:hypothetical protein n=1 Tax=Ruegeria jejuensis TaxID=3233338 RepID=UPI00355BBBB9
MQLLRDIVGGFLSYALAGSFLAAALYGGLYFLQFGAAELLLFLAALSVLAALTFYVIRKVVFSATAQEDCEGNDDK